MGAQTTIVLVARCIRREGTAGATQQSQKNTGNLCGDRCRLSQHEGTSTC